MERSRPSRYKYRWERGGSIKVVLVGVGARAETVHALKVLRLRVVAEIVIIVVVGVVVGAVAFAALERVEERRE